MNELSNKEFHTNLPDHSFNAICDAVSRLENINIYCETCTYASTRRNWLGMKYCDKLPRKRCPRDIDIRKD